MSFIEHPNKSFARLQVGSQYHDLDLTKPSEGCPQQIEDFLRQAGWGVNGQDGDTYEPLFIKMQEDATEKMRFRWYEAVAYEFWKFLTLTNGND